MQRTATRKDKAVAEIKDQAVDQAHELKDTAVEHVGAVTQEAKEKATNVAHDIRRELESQGESQAKRLATTLHDAGRQLHDMANGAEPGPLTQVTRQLAEGTERLAGRVDDGGIQGVGDELRGFARRQPVLFLVAAGTAGFFVTRMLRHAGGGNGGADADTARVAVPSLPAASPTDDASLPPTAQP